MTHPPRPAVVTQAFGSHSQSAPTQGARPDELPRAVAAPRFGQLTYSSFDDGTGIGGGWQVKDVVGDLSESESELLRYWTETSLELVTPLPQFPTPEDIASFPRRLMYIRLDEGRAGYWHSAPAGADGSGRPGNVFAHTVLDRRATDTHPTLRPIDTWRSPSWLVPYGAAGVVAATLSANDFPGEAATVDRESVVQFLCDPDRWRLGILAVLLDAVSAALEGGPKVVLGTESVDSAAFWIAAVSHLMSAGTARELSWSTFDRAAGVAVSASRGVVLIAIPIADMAAVALPETLVILSEDEVPEMGDLGGASHQTRAGSMVQVTEWSVIAQGVLIDPDTARAALDLQDSVAASIGDSGLAPAWPLAMAVAMTQALQEDVGNEAAAVVARHSPESLGSRPELVGPAAALIDRTLGETAEDCWRRLEGTRPGRAGGYSIAAELLMTVYVERALRDRNWLTQNVEVPFLKVLPRDGWAPDRLVQQIESVVDTLSVRAMESARADSQLAFETLRTLDLLIRAHCLPRSEQPAVAAASDFNPLRGRSSTPLSLLGRCQNTIESTLIPVLFDAQMGPQFAQYFGPLDARTSEALVIPVVASATAMNTGTIGQRLPVETLAWLLPAHPAGLASPTILANLAMGDEAYAPTVLMAELAAAHFANRMTRAAWTKFNILVLWRVLEQTANPSVRPPHLEAVLVGAYKANHLIPLLTRFAGVIPPRYFVTTAIFAPLSAELKLLAELLRASEIQFHGPALAQPDAADSICHAILAVRTHSSWHAMVPREREELQRVHLPSALRESLRQAVTVLPVDLVDSLAVLCVAEIIEHPSNLDNFELVKLAVRAAYGGRRKDLVAAIAGLTGAGIQIHWLVESALTGALDAPETRIASVSEKFLCALTTEIDDRTVSLIDEVVDLLVEQGRYAGPTDPDAIEKMLHARVIKTYPRGADKVLGQYRKVSKKWLDERGLGPGGMFSRLRRK